MYCWLNIECVVSELHLKRKMKWKAAAINITGGNNSLRGVDAREDRAIGSVRPKLLICT